MGKLRTRKTLAKRVKITSTGKFLRTKNETRHLRVKMTASGKHRKNQNGSMTITNRRNLSKMMPGVRAIKG